MKKPINSKKIAYQDLSVKTTLPDVGLLLYLVEMLAERRTDAGFSRKRVPLGWQAMESSSIEAFVNGSTTLTNDYGTAETELTTSFLFTCLKGKANDYRFTWLSSLS